MKLLHAKISFFSGNPITTIFENEERKKSFEKAISSDSKFININGNLYAISSVMSVEFLEKEKITMLYENLSEENKRLYDTNPNEFLGYEIMKTIEDGKNNI